MRKNEVTDPYLLDFTIWRLETNTKTSIDQQWNSDHELGCVEEGETDYSPIISLGYKSDSEAPVKSRTRERAPSDCTNQAGLLSVGFIHRQEDGVSKTSSHTLKPKDKTRSTDFSKSTEISAFITNIVCCVRKIDVS